MIYDRCRVQPIPVFSGDIPPFDSGHRQEYWYWRVTGDRAQAIDTAKALPQGTVASFLGEVNWGLRLPNGDVAEVGDYVVWSGNDNQVVRYDQASWSETFERSSYAEDCAASGHTLVGLMTGGGAGFYCQCGDVEWTKAATGLRSA